jgi:hypothetical protein
VIQAKILEVGTEEMKFKVFSAPDGPVIILKIADIRTARVAGQTIISSQEAPKPESEDMIVKKSGDHLKVKILDIGTEEVNFRL